jgi:hypothetical protein
MPLDCGLRTGVKHGPQALVAYKACSVSQDGPSRDAYPVPVDPPVVSRTVACRLASSMDRIAITSFRDRTQKIS